MTKALATYKVAAVGLGLALVLGAAFAFATPAKADVISDLQAQIQSLLAQIAALQTGSTTTGGSCTGFTFTRNHSQGDTGGEVMQIQKFLNSMSDTQVSTSGAGSPGNETSYFGPATKAAVIKYQNKYAASILTPVGLTSGTGFWGASSRAHANSMNTSCTGTGTGTGTTVPTGTGLTVSAAAQPANSLAPTSAARVPFTTFTLTNNSGVAVTVNGVNVERTGLAQDAVFSGLVLVDENGTQLGNSRTLNSSHQAKVGDPFVINPGQTKTITVAGNMASSLTAYAGQVVALSVIGIDTSATVAGSLPITGAQHTINATLSLGSLTVNVGTSDPNTSATKEIGTADYLFQSIRAQAGSAEDVSIKSIRWNQTGSASSADLSNVRTVVDGVEYPATVSSDGKYYTTVFPGNGIQIQKGLQKEMEIKATIIGGSARTVIFDVYKETDIYAVGGIFGYGITASAGSTSAASAVTSQFTTGTPFFDGATVTISAGSVSSVSRANEVPAQNVVENSPNQPIGGFVVDIKGEGLMVQQQVFYITDTSSTADAADLTNVTLVDENGAVVAGPVDGVAIAGTGGKVTFTDTVTYPTGRHVYTLKGQYGSDFTNGDTVQASTTPSTDWSNVTGQSTGDTISVSGLSAIVSANTMTVKAGAVTITVASSPSAQNVVAGVTGFTVSNIQFDATQSGEDVKFSSAQFRYEAAGTTEVTNCFAWDGSTRLNNSSVNPTAAGAQTFTFDNNFIATKGTVKTVAIKCDFPGSMTTDETVDFGIHSSDTISGTGLSSSQTVAGSVTTTSGPSMTVKNGGTLTVVADSTSPAYKIAAAGTSEVTLGVLKFHATNEDMRLDRIALQMSNSSASSSPSNLSSVTIWDGATQVGTAVFTGSNRNATSTLTSTVIIPKDGDKILTIKGNLSAIGTSQPGTQGALVQVDYDGTDSTGTRAIGQSSGTTVNTSSTSDTAVDGVRVFRSFPTFAKIASATTLVSGTTNDLYRFSITANNSGNGIGLYKLTANIGTSTATTTNLKVFAYTDSGFSSPVSGFTDGQVVATVADLVSSGDNDLVLSSVLQIPAGATYYFKVVGDVTVTATTGTSQVSTRISGDSAYPSIAAALLQIATGVDGDTNDDFIWSPNATTTSAAAHVDWTNGYQVPGLSSSGSDLNTLSKTN